MKTIFLLDGSACFYRAFHAIPLFTTSAGEPTNAIYGFTQTLRKLIKEHSPDYIGVAFDLKGPTFRHKLYDEYKAKRPKMPDELVSQIPGVKEVIRALGVPVIEKEGYEADDVIAALTGSAKAMSLRVVIVSGDKDLYQLVDESTVVLDLNKGKEFGIKEVTERFGVLPEQIVDFLALSGDSSDNIPGLPGVGPKTALKLIAEHKTLDGIYENLSAVKSDKLRQNLVENKALATLSKELATLIYDIELDVGIDDMKFSGPDQEALKPLFKKYEFTKLYKEIIMVEDEVEIKSTLLTSLDELKVFSNDLMAAHHVALYPVMDERSACGRLLGMALSTEAASSTYIHLSPEAISEASLFAALRGVIDSAKVSLLSDDAKVFTILTHRNSFETGPVALDTGIGSYLLNPSLKDHSIDALSVRYLDRPLSVIKGALEASSPELLSVYAAERAAALIGVSAVLSKKLEEERLGTLFRDMEMPLSAVLADMELTGIKVEPEPLKSLSTELAGELLSLEERIYSMAGESFNINSPKQLSELLFDRMKIKPVKKTKTGFSTDESVLKALSKEHDLPLAILRYRQLAKLKSTYVDALLTLIDPSDGRVHTSFNQTVTATGRLSSSRPNLQNIPVRDGYAARIREAFVARPGHTFLAADYSQIELRLAAHMSGDPELIGAFERGDDIHTRTAAEVFGIMAPLVTKEMRRRAKAINFGIIYGMGAYGLSSDLEISVAEAAEYIENYFAHYKRIKEFIDETIGRATEVGYTETLFGRRRFIPELKSKGGPTRRFGERMAVNTPIQGSAADMIKVAMINIDGELRSRGFSARMVLQIHDELLFEAPCDELKALTELVTAGMEGVVRLKVPVIVNVKSGVNWVEAG